MDFLKKIPAGIMIVPMLLATCINTAAPDFLKMGGMFSALFSSGSLATLSAAIFFCCGTQLKLKEAPQALKRGGVLLLTKFAVGFLLGVMSAKFFGSAGFFGISALAFFAGTTNSNGGVYLALTGEYGDEVDWGAYSMLTINDGPFLCLMALGASGLATIPVKSILLAVAPMFIGVVLANLDSSFQKFFEPGVSLLLPLVAWSLGSSINLGQLLTAGISGILLGVITIVAGGILGVLTDRYINHRPGYAGMATATVAANAAATPAIAAGIDPSLAGVAAMATAQIAAAVIITSIAVPFITVYVINKFGCPKFDREKGLAQSVQNAQAD